MEEPAAKRGRAAVEGTNELTRMAMEMDCGCVTTEMEMDASDVHLFCENAAAFIKKKTHSSEVVYSRLSRARQTNFHEAKAVEVSQFLQATAVRARLDAAGRCLGQQAHYEGQGVEDHPAGRPGCSEAEDSRGEGCSEAEGSSGEGCRRAF